MFRNKLKKQICGPQSANFKPNSLVIGIIL
jgi:hypothetical protein